MKEKKVGIRDVAREAGVSITTVSRALNGYADVNEETRKRILEVVKRLNYAPNVGRDRGRFCVPVCHVGHRTVPCPV